MVSVVVVPSPISVPVVVVVVVVAVHASRIARPTGVVVGITVIVSVSTAATTVMAAAHTSSVSSAWHIILKDKKLLLDIVAMEPQEPETPLTITQIAHLKLESLK